MKSCLYPFSRAPSLMYIIKNTIIECQVVSGKKEAIKTTNYLL